MNARNIDKNMMEYINLLHSSNDQDEPDIDTSEHVIKSGLLRKVLDKLGIEITYKWWEIALDAQHPIINNKRYDHKDLSK